MDVVTILAVGAGGAIVTALLTPLFARFARRAGFVARPSSERWGVREIPLLGGPAIVLGALGPAAVIGGADPTFMTIALATIAAGALGLADDARGLRPTSKLVGQVAIGSLLAIGGVTSAFFAEAGPLAFAVTVIWVVGLMNAVNLVDNMDGLSAGLGAIAAIVLVITPGGSSALAALAAGTAGACIGFLIHNFPPARAFMGDAGSLPLGCLLASLALIATNQAASGVGLAILAPLLALGLPIFDTALVTLVRRLEGRPVSKGGRDHTSHRLAALGLSDRETVLVLYGIAGGMAAIGLLATELGFGVLPVVALVVIALILFGVFLVEQPTDVTGIVAPGSRRSIIGSGNRLARYGLEVGLDATLAGLALISAYLLRFEAAGPAVWVPLFMAALPIVAPIQLLVFVLLGVYRILWRFVSVGDLVVIARSTILGTFAAGTVVLLLQRDLGQSRGVFLIDAVLLTVLVAASRLFLVSLRETFVRRRRKIERRVLIVGATETGEVALRLLLRSPEPGYHPAGFIDDDPGKHRRRIGGVPVLGTVDELPRIAREHNVDLVVAALDDRNGALVRIREKCSAAGVELREFAPL